MSSLLVFLHGSAELYGSDKVLLNLAGSLVGDRTFEPVVVLNEDGPLVASLMHAGVEVHVAPVVKISRAAFGFSTPYTLIRDLRRANCALDKLVAGRRIALIYSNTLAVLGGAFWARGRRAAHVWHVHEILLRPRTVNLILPRLAQWLSHRVICNSEQTQDWVLSSAPGLRLRSEVIWNGLPPVAPVDAKLVSAFREQLGLTSEHLIVTLAGRLNHWKGQDLLIEAVSVLSNARRLSCKLQVLIVGDALSGQGGVRERLVKQVLEAGLGANVRFLPFTSDLNTVWQASDIAVVPSLEPEPFGMVAIEAMAFGLPVVAAAHGGLLNIVVHQQTGLLFEPGNAQALAEAIWELGNNQKLRLELGAKGKERQQAEFSLATQMAKTRKLCLEVAGLA